MKALVVLSHLMTKDGTLEVESEARAKFAIDNRKDLMNLAQNKDISMQDIAGSTEFAKDIKNDGLADAVANLSPKDTQGLADVYNFAKGTDLYNRSLTDYTGTSDFQKPIDQTVNFFSDNYNKLTDDTANNRRVVSDMMIGRDPNLEPLKKLGYQIKENPNLSSLGIRPISTKVKTPQY